MSETTGKQKRDWYSIFLSTISLALAVLVVLLVLQNRDLKDKLRSAATAGPQGGLSAGETLPSFQLVDGSGAPVQVSVGDGRRRLLLVFTSTCSHCEDAMPIWRDLVREKGSATEVLGVQIDAGTASAKPIDTLPFAVLAPGQPPPEFLTKLSGWPCSIVVDGTGKIERLFYGPPEGKNLANLREALRS
jgi:hypothetical protein